MNPVRAQGTGSPLTLGWDLLKLGAMAFGGLGTTLALLQRRLDVHPALLLGSAIVLAAERAGLSPILLLVSAVALGAGSALLA